MTHKTIFYILLIASVVFGNLYAFTKSIFMLSIQIACLAAALFMQTTPFHRIAARYLWKKYGDDADWEYVDRVDTYCTEYNVTLEVFGYSFFGCGVNSAGEMEINDIVCTCPDGTVVVII